MATDGLKPAYVSIDDASRYMGGRDRARIYNLIHAGQIEASKDGRRTLIKLASIDAYLDRQRIKEFASADEMRRRRKVHTDRMRRLSHSPIGSDAT